MPIRPENRDKYPKNWKAIRAEVLKRDGHCCKTCKVHNGSRGYRMSDGNWREVYSHDGTLIDPDHETEEECAGIYRTPRWQQQLFPIVLTVAHLDHDPKNNGEPGNRPNLAALCQQCHNRYDTEHRTQTRAETRRRRREAKIRRRGPYLPHMRRG